MYYMNADSLQLLLLTSLTFAQSTCCDHVQLSENNAVVAASLSAVREAHIKIGSSTERTCLSDCSSDARR
jgi:hypothetical protein